MATIHLQPQDVLYFGGGQQTHTPWPLPSVVFGALHAALHRAFPQVQLWESLHAFGQNGRYPNRSEKRQRFGALKTAGPFPSLLRGQEAAWLFPAPIAAHQEEPGTWGEYPPRRFEPGRGHADSREILPSDAVYHRDRTSFWWSKAAVESWLTGVQPDSAGVWEENRLFDREPTLESHIQRPPACLADSPRTDYLRCRDDLTLGCVASMALPGRDLEDGLAHLWNGPGRILSVGGRQRLCRMIPNLETPLEALLPLSQTVEGERVKWLLLSPVIFPPLTRQETKPYLKAHPGGSLPSWVCPETGQVLLRKGMGERPAGSREEWRQRTRQLPPLNCRLVAANLPPLISYQGWSERRHLRFHLQTALPGPKPAIRVLPAGAVYYFEGPDAPELARLLSWHGGRREGLFAIAHRRSAIEGEKGFGIGVCGPWNDLSDGLRARAAEIINTDAQSISISTS